MLIPYVSSQLDDQSLWLASSLSSQSDVLIVDERPNEELDRPLGGAPSVIATGHLGLPLFQGSSTSPVSSSRPAVRKGAEELRSSSRDVLEAS